MVLFERCPGGAILIRRVAIHVVEVIARVAAQGLRGKLKEHRRAGHAPIGRGGRFSRAGPREIGAVQASPNLGQPTRSMKGVPMTAFSRCASVRLVSIATA